MVAGKRQVIPCLEDIASSADRLIKRTGSGDAPSLFLWILSASVPPNLLPPRL